MHELSIAQNIIDAVNLEVEKNRAKKVTAINIDVGELMQLDTDSLEYLLNTLLTGGKLDGAKLHLHVKEASFVCNKCGGTWSMKEVRKQLEKVPDSLLVREPDSKEVPLHFLPYLYSSFVTCPKCGSADTKALEGDDITLRKLVMK